MEKYRSTNAYSRYNEIKRHKQNKRKNLEQLHDKLRRRKINELYRFKGFRLVAPSCFSLIENYSESLDFLEIADSHFYHKRNTFVDLSEIKQISPCAILSLTLFLQKYQALPNPGRIQGNAPKDEYCRKVFLNSGFYKFVISGYQHCEDNDILSVRTNDRVISEDAGAVVSFVRSKLNIHRSKTRAIYQTIMETMNNVLEHAYHDISHKYWWLMALYTKNNELIRFTMLDNGRGIPTTVRKRFPDLFFGTDANLIRSTMLNQHRSETKLPYRGLGLPRIKFLVDSGKIKNLKILSKNGLYDVDNDKCFDLSSSFHGTIISWDFFKEL